MCSLYGSLISLMMVDIGKECGALQNVFVALSPFNTTTLKIFLGG
jgi:hypothetical protein